MPDDSRYDRAMADEHAIRPMRSEDVDPAAEVMINGGRATDVGPPLLRRQARCVPLVARSTTGSWARGVATVSGPVGSVG